LPQYIQLAENTFYVKGSPATIIHIVEGEAYVVDPGSGSKRRKMLKSILKSLGVSEYHVILTHYHADHIAIANKLSPKNIYSSKLDRVFVENRILRNYATYGYPFSNGAKHLLYDAPDITVTKMLSPPCKLGDSVEVFPLPGHTLGQVGVLFSDGVFYIGDAAFGDRVLSAVGIPYYFDAILAAETVRKIIENSDEYEKIVLSHGPLLGKNEVLKILKTNLERISDVVSKVKDKLSLETVCPGVLAAKILLDYGVEQTTTLQMLSTVTVKSILSHLEKEGYAEAVVTGNGVLWRKR